MRTTLIVGFVLTGLIALPSPADTLTNAVTAPMDERELGFTLSGKVEQVLVKEGDVVEKGQVLLKLAAEEQKATVTQGEFDVDNADLQIAAAGKERDMAKTEYENKKRLEKQNAASPFEVLSAELQFELSKIRLKLTEQQKEAYRLELDKQNAILNRFVLTAPIAGRIERVNVSEGETMRALNPVVLLVVTDPLKVEADVNYTDALKLKKGDKAWVSQKVQGLSEAMLGRIVFTASWADPASETLRIKIEVPNPKGLKAGTHVTVGFSDPKRVASARATGD